MSVSSQNPDGTWTNAEPLPLTNDFDADVYGTGPRTWTAYRGDAEVAHGHARTRIGLHVALLWARIRTAQRRLPPTP